MAYSRVIVKMMLLLLALNAPSCDSGSSSLTPVFPVYEPPHAESVRYGTYQQTVKAVLSGRADARTVIGRYGDTLLHVASQYGKLTEIKSLIEGGANIEDRNMRGRTALHVAVLAHIPLLEYGEDRVGLLLESGASLESRDAYGMSALDIAAALGDTDMVRRMLRAGAAVEAKNEVGYGPLSYAIWYGQTETAEYLLQNGARLDAPTAAGLGRIEWVKKGLKMNRSALASVDGMKRTPLHWASVNDRQDIAALLIAQNVDGSRADKYGFSALDYALRRGGFRVAEMLFKRGCKARRLAVTGVYALLIAARQGTARDVVMLLENGVNVNGTLEELGNATALQGAAHSGNVKTVRALLNHGARVNDARVGHTALHFAVGQKHREIVRLLIRAGANLDARDCTSETALHSAVKHKDIELVKLLVDGGASLDMRVFGETALHCAVLSGQDEIARYLVESEIARHSD